MAGAKQTEARDDASDHPAGPKLPTGVTLRTVLSEHLLAVLGVAFDPRGGLLASGSYDQTVKLWDLASNRLVRSLDGHRGAVNSVAFDRQGGILASASDDNTVRLWDVTSGRLLRSLEGHSRAVTSVAFDPQGGTFASGSQDRTVKLWDVASGRLLRSLGGRQGAINSVTFDPQGRTLASASHDGLVQVWDAINGRLVSFFAGDRGSNLSFSFRLKDKTLASETTDHTPKIDEGQADLLRSLGLNLSSVYGVAFNRHGTTLASASADNTVKLWGLARSKLLRTLEGHTGRVEAIAFSPDGSLLASMSSDHTIRLWSCETWETVAVIPVGTSTHRRIPVLAFHPDERLERPVLATATSSATEPYFDPGHHIELYEIDVGVLLGRHSTSAVSYTSSKVVLVGESNAGKSYLAHRLATGLAPADGAILSTHGMAFWRLEASQRNSDGFPANNQPRLPEAHADKLFGSHIENDRWHRRDIVLWDMGGQEEYRLVHQLFLHDTTVALVLLDPTRGATAFKEVETWNKSLEKQLRGRAAVKLLVGAKQDHASQMVDRDAIERLRRDCGFANYIETSALTGRGVEDLCTQIGQAIDWKNLCETSRTELFQAIRDEIETRRQRGQVVVPFDDLDRELHSRENAEAFSLLHHEIALSSDAEAGTRALATVCSHLAQQGMIARASTSTGKDVLILRIEQIERYAGSLILAARANRCNRGVPALELRTIAQEQFRFPGIVEGDRLPRTDETAVVECTVQLLLQHGICFQHEGLLIFPSLFAASPDFSAGTQQHAVSLYYDFAGAIDNIYASLVAWLVLAKEFGKVRLLADRAEFEVADSGLYGLRKVTRPGGFAHVDVYFDERTPIRKRQEFTSFVEDHLATHGVEVREHVAIKCSCGEEFAEETIRRRIARGDHDVACSVCDTRHSLAEGATAVREKNPEIAQHTWALRTRVEHDREEVTRTAIQTIGRAEAIKSDDPIRILHLSDLHFTKDTPVSARLQWLLDDLQRRHPDGLGFKTLDYLVISGDFTDRGSEAGLEKAYDFVSGLAREFGLSAERCMFVPGNHDIVDRLDAYKRHKDESGLKEGEWFREGKLVMGRDAERYPFRFEPFSKSFYHKFLQRPYPLDYVQQGISVSFWDTGIQFLLFNSCWQIDEFHRDRSGLHAESVAHAIRQAQQQEQVARQSGQLAAEQPLLRLAIWHHAVTGINQMQNTAFLENLQKNGVRLALHGDIHEYDRNQVGYSHDKGIHVVGSGSFGARGIDRPESIPRLYNVLEIGRKLRSARIHTRCQPKPDGSWRGWHEWPDPEVLGRVAHYDINW